ncbi:P-loop containing nucleoside triphosphate hydrolase protein [Gorgonomyces haynaldii]|nr:P-loop containing nucleoside triphosphate hydrolase protein [Gorgonomyces haynaldii]
MPKVKEDKSDEEFETVAIDHIKEETSDEEEPEGYQDHIQQVNRKGKKSGGFQSMGLSYPVYKSVMGMGYKVPTPIQRKAIPVVLQGKDIVAMARTGSGKTAAFLIPMIEKLKQHSVKVGVRALVLSPSRELATQTLKFCRDFAKHTDLRSQVFVGGDSMEDQFSALASNPDIVVATPGRLMHLIIEMNLDLKTVEYLVFDEADRLFELGFAEQLREITLRLPPTRQTLLFSATLPKILVDFARAGLVNPTLIRLDVDSKIPRDLQMYFFSCKHESKEGALLYLLRNCIPQEQQTIVFVSTKHHVEYIHEILKENGLSSTYIYGALDQAARKGNLARFRYGKAKIMVVTDVASRGVDIPLLDNVINYDFPPASKVFVHRVGRTARAGRRGAAWSLVSQDELPYMLDLQLFTGRPLVFASQLKDQKPNYTTELIYGNLPSYQVDLESESFVGLCKSSVAIQTMQQSCVNGFKLYIKSRPPATKASHQRAKDITNINIGIHPLFADQINSQELEQLEMVNSLTNFRPPETIFEIGKRGGKSSEAILMQKRRRQLQNTIQLKKKQLEEKRKQEQQQQEKAIQKNSEEKEFYLSYRPSDADAEQGYAMQKDFSDAARQAAMDLVGDDPDDLRKRGQLKWDSKNHRFSRDQVGSDNKKRIKTDQGTVVLASFKSDRFERWKKNTKTDMPKTGEQEIQGFQHKERRYRHNTVYNPNTESKNFARKVASMEKTWRKEGKTPKDIGKMRSEYVSQFKEKNKVQSELKSASEIAKARKLKDQRRAKTGRHNQKAPKRKPRK